MSINYIPNDPEVSQPPMRVISPRANRPASCAGFTFFGEQPEDVFDPASSAAGVSLLAMPRGSARSAGGLGGCIRPAVFVLAGIEKKIDLRADDGVQLNAFYDRSSLRFFRFSEGGQTFLSGASTDVVAHEAGHGILDAGRPELWQSSLFEVNAFHEAFGDCVAILTALLDRPSWQAALTSLAEGNFIEAGLETLALGIKKIRPTHNAAAARRARNKFSWHIPSTLPEFGSADDGPGKLINEEHSFGQIFSGCFYDTIVNIFQANGGATDAQLLAATRIAGRLLAKAIATAPPKARFFREVGRAMVKADEEENGAANRDAIRAAFNGHDLPLGTGAMLAPVAALAGAAPTIGATSASLGRAAKKDLLARMGATGEKLVMSALRIGGEKVAEVLHERQVPLDSLHSRLKGVVAKAQVAVLVGDLGGRAAVLGSMPEAAATHDEVTTFVRALLKKGAIDLGQGAKRVGARSAAASVATPQLDPITHTIKTIRGNKVLTRLRYACGCCQSLR